MKAYQNRSMSSTNSADSGSRNGLVEEGDWHDSERTAAALTDTALTTAEASSSPNPAAIVDPETSPPVARKQTDLSDAELLRQAYGDEVVVSGDESTTLLIDGVAFPKKRPREMTEDEQDEMYAALHSKVLKTAQALAQKQSTLGSIRALLNGRASGVLAHHDAAETAVAEPEKDDVTSRTLVLAPGASQPAVSRPRRMYTVASDHVHAMLGKVRIKFVSWMDEANLTSTGRIVYRGRHSGFPHVVRMSRCNATECWVTATSPFDVCAEIRYLKGSQCTTTDELLAHANDWIGGTSADLSELRFELHLINATGDGRYGASERPFACDDERSQFRPGVGLGRSADGKNVTNLFKNFDPATSTSETFYGTCSHGRIVFKNIVFRSDVLSSRVKTGDGAFRFVIRATHPALKDLYNFTAITDPFFVGARVRCTEEQKPRASSSVAAEE